MCAQVLEGLGLTEEQFIDMCILCGCDYCGTIRGTSSAAYYHHWFSQPSLTVHHRCTGLFSQPSCFAPALLDAAAFAGLLTGLPLLPQVLVHVSYVCIAQDSEMHCPAVSYDASTALQLSPSQTLNPA